MAPWHRRTTLPHWHSSRVGRPALTGLVSRAPFAAALALLLLAAACSGPSPSPTPGPSPEAASPSPSAPRPGLAAALSPSPSPGLPAPSPVAPPSAAPPPAVAETNFQIDDYPFAVMIDNIAEARPQFGLAGADVVYEAPAEAGIPRLMPIFLRAGGEADSIGPVRSTRHYFVYLAHQYAAPL